jgi:hypothetical protein
MVGTVAIEPTTPSVSKFDRRSGGDLCIFRQKQCARVQYVRVRNQMRSNGSGALATGLRATSARRRRCKTRKRPVLEATKMREAAVREAQPRSRLVFPCEREEAMA